MSLEHSIAKNTLIQGVGKGLSTVLGLVVVAMVTRYLGPQGYGQYTVVITFLSFFGVIADFGLTLITAQMISEQGADEPRIVKSIFTFRVLTALAIFSLAPVVAYFTDYSTIVKLGIALVSWSFFFVSLNQTLVGIFQKRLQMHFPSIAENVGRIILLGATIIAIWLHWNLVALLGAVVLGNIANFAMTVFYTRRYFKLGFAWEAHIIREMVRRATPIAISTVFNLVYLKADTLILFSFRPAAEVGLYGAAYRVVDILMMLPVIIMGMSLPAISYARSVADEVRVKRMIEKLLSLFVVYALPVLAGGMMLAGSVMAFVAGKQFFAAGQPLRILLWAFAAATFSTLFGHLVVALGQQRRAIWIYGVDAVLALGAYFIFIPRFGSMAAAWVTFGSELFAMVCLAVLAWRAVKFNWWPQILWPNLLAVLGMVLVIYLLRGLPVLLIIAVAIIVYGVLLWLGKVPHKLLWAEKK